MMSVTAPMRPPRIYATGYFVRGLRVVSLIVSVLISAWVVAQYPSMPDKIPTHFDVMGQPDSYGEKSSVLWISGVMVAMAVLTSWASTKPGLLNYPNLITEANAQFIYREGERMMVFLAADLLLLHLGMALSWSSGNGHALTVVGMIGLLVVLVVSIVRIFSAGRKTPAPTGDTII
ncbi:DUF1648 domain-containing protein [Glutamicibacter sp.]|jgi:Protein of unknown function (DUF1648).|uniref:DUF1648 domain-containing protein n=2 Tax=Glutamicibacter sp. TaxID=1931995 RepID=UPI002B49D25C|nr:DUF1648 domain-containing protein [Glutamicibacter sp.]HJX78733.1 DUF1648 domain-containing protein [Glutamicibacter sp.]